MNEEQIREVCQKLNMEIAIDKGLGYVPADKNKRPDQPIGMIPVDSIYSPITRDISPISVKLSPCWWKKLINSSGICRLPR
jgi:hypothetical protein